MQKYFSNINLKKNSVTKIFCNSIIRKTSPIKAQQNISADTSQKTYKRLISV
jgi:hypothetical protein